jgi:hypothetical protein
LTSQQAAQESRQDGTLGGAVVAKTEGNQIERADPQKTTDKPEGGIQMPTRAGMSEWIRDNANAVIAVFTIVIAVIAFIQGLIYNAQLREMRIDQRAWVAVKFTPLAGPVVGQLVPAPIIVVNVGKTVAKNAKGWVFVRPVPISTTIDVSDPSTLKLSSVAPGEPIPAWTEYENGVLYPNDVGPIPGAAMVNTPVGARNPVPTKWDQTLQDKWNNGDIYLAIHGKLTYEDAAGRQHWTTFCFTYVAPTSGKSVSMDTANTCSSYMTVDGNE